MRVAALFSGGKDSVFSIYIAQQWGWDISSLVTIEPHKPDSWMYHSVNISQTKLLAEALSIPLATETSTGKQEEELSDLKNVLHNLDIDGVISGAIASEYQRTRIERICHELGIKSFTPLWHKNQEQLLYNMIHAGFRIMIVGVFAQGFTESWLGRIIDESALQDLKNLQSQYKINFAGEGGEYETLVLDGPILRKRLVVDEFHHVWKRDHGILQITKAHLEHKH